MQKISLRRLWAGGCLLGLFVLLMPWEPFLGMRSNSRLYTLKPVAEGNDQRRWGDLIDFLRRQPQARVLSDHYTCQLLGWMGLAVRDGTWWIGAVLPDADRLKLLRNLDRQQDWLLVVNQRDGDFSANGARSSHWWANAWMNFATAYSEDALLFIEQHPEVFKEIWSGDRIQIYDIVESRVWE